jgi:Fe-S-cluster containining protein
MSTSNEDIQLCARCGGQCCLTKPGIEAPERFNASGDLAAALHDALASGNWVLEEHLGIPYQTESASPDPDRLIYYPRPATLAEQQQSAITPLPGSGVCVFLTDNGCQLAFAERPRLCRELVPDVCFECESPWGRREAALAWLPWQDHVTVARARLTTTGRTTP